MPETSNEAKPLESPDKFIDRVLSPEYVRNLMSEAGCDIRRGVFHPVMTMWLMIYQRISGRSSLAHALAAFHKGVGGVLMERGNRLRSEVSISTGGLSQARTRIPEAAVAAMVDTLNETIIGSHPEHLWHGRNAYVLDGTDFRALAEGDIRKEYPPSRDDKRSSSWSTIRSVIATHVITGVAVRPESGAMYGPHACGPYIAPLSGLTATPVITCVAMTLRIVDQDEDLLSSLEGGYSLRMSPSANARKSVPSRTYAFLPCQRCSGWLPIIVSLRVSTIAATAASGIRVLA